MLMVREKNIYFMQKLAEADLRRKLKRAARTARTRARSQRLPSGDNKQQSREVVANKGALFQKAGPE